MRTIDDAEAKRLLQPTPAKTPFDRTISDAEFAVIRDGLEIALKYWVEMGNLSKAKVARAVLDYLVVDTAKVVTNRPARICQPKQKRST